MKHNALKKYAKSGMNNRIKVEHIMAEQRETNGAERDSCVRGPGIKYNAI